MKTQKKFAALIAAPVALAAIAGGFAFTANNDVATIGAVSTEQTDYIVPMTSYIGNPGDTITLADAGDILALYGRVPQFQTAVSGETASATAVQGAGDLAYIDTWSNSVDAGGNVITGLDIQAQVVNLPEVQNALATCALPVRLYQTDDLGVTWNDITEAELDAAPGEPYWVDCNTGRFDFTLRGEDKVNKQFVMTIEQGGSIVPFDADGLAADHAPKFNFQATPLTGAN